MAKDVDFDMCAGNNDMHKWFDKFSMPEISDYKPNGYNQLANFAVDTHYRGLGLGKLLVEEIIKNYALNYQNVSIRHSQPLICGKGLFQIADPSWRKYMIDIGFGLRLGAETFYIDKEWDPLLPVIINGNKIDNVTYNHMFGMPKIYETDELNAVGSDIHLTKRIPEVIELANSTCAKLQYFQLVYPFGDFRE